MGDSVGFYNWGFSILNSEIQDFWNINVVKGYAKMIPSILVKECSMNEEPIGKCPYMNLISNWTKQEKCIKIIEYKLKKWIIKSIFKKL